MGAFKDLTGQSFDRLTVLKQAGRDHKGSILWECKCRCGNKVNVVGYDLTREHTTSCGCKHTDFDDLTGRCYGEWTVKKCVGKTSSRIRKWLCECSCGTERIIYGGELKRKKCRSISCGCSRIKVSIGEHYGYWTIKERAKRNDRGRSMWKCECICGTEKIIENNSLLSGNSTNCGCKRYEIEKILDSTANKVILGYKRHAKDNNKNIEFLLTNEQAKEIMAKPCTYCGMESSNKRKSTQEGIYYIYNGIDRIDSNENYTIENTVACCKQCNIAKSDYSINEFYTHVIQVVDFLNSTKGLDVIRMYIEKDMTIDDFNEDIYNYAHNACTKNAKKRGYDFCLSKYEFIKRIADNCFYCGKLPSNEVWNWDKTYSYGFYNGIDRRDNTTNYTSKNSVPCCFKCNTAKSDYTEEEFYMHYLRIYEFLNLKEYNI